MMQNYKNTVAALLGTFMLAACSGQPIDPSPKTDIPTNTSPPPIITPPPIAQARVKIRSINFKDPALANYMKYLTRVETDMYADELETLTLGGATSLAGLEYFTNLKTLTVSGEVKDTVDLSHNTFLETLEIKADSLLLSQNNRLAKLTAQVQHIELPSASQLTELHLTHGPVISPQSKARYSSAKNPSLSKFLKLDLSNQRLLTQLSLSGQFEEVVLPSNSQLERFTLTGSATASIVGLANQKTLKFFSAILDKNTETLKFGTLPQLEELVLIADGLRSIDIYNLPKLHDLTLHAENITQIVSDKNQFNLRNLRLATPKISTFDLSAYTKLEGFEYANGLLSSLNFAYTPLINLSLGNTQLKTFNPGRCTALIGLVIGYNQLDKLDLSPCKTLGFASIHPSTAQTNDVLTTQLKLPAGLVRDMPEGAQQRISELTAVDVPDERLLSCLQTSAAEEKALYVPQLKNLTCRGQESKLYYQAFDSRQAERTGYSKTHVFDTTGLELFSGLETIDLSVNWITDIQLGLANVKKLNLDGNIIQAAYLQNMPSLTELNLNSNPLRTVQLPPSLTQLSATSGITSNGYVTYILGNYNVEMLRESREGAFITEANFNQQFAVENLAQLTALIDIKSERVILPAAPIPGVARLRISEMAIKDEHLRECIGAEHTYADEVKRISCSNRGRTEERLIRSIKGLEQLKNVEDVNFYGHDFGALDLSGLKALKTIRIYDSNVSKIDFTKNTGLEDVSFNNYNPTAYPNIIFDFTQNKNLRRIEIYDVSEIKLPPSESLEFLSLRFVPQKPTAKNQYPSLDLSQYDHLYSLSVQSKLDSLTLPTQSVLETYGCYQCAPEKLLNLEKQSHLLSVGTSLPDDIKQLDLTQLSRLRSAIFESATLKQLTLPTDSKINQLTIESPELTSLETTNLGRIEQLNLSTPKLGALNIAAMPKLTELSVSDYAFKQLDVSKLALLKKLSLGDGALQQLTFGPSHLEHVSIGMGQLKALDFTQLTNLITLSLGRNPLKILDLQANKLITALTYTQPAPTDIRLPQLDYELPTTIVPAAKKIAQLTAADMPDVLLRSCVAKAAKEQGVIYTDELTQLSCRGEDSKGRLVVSNYIDGGNLENYTCCVFDLKGLSQFSRLENLDLTGNWISTINPDDINLHKLKTLILDHNAIQTIEIPWGVIVGDSEVRNKLHSVSLNANPLSTVNLPKNVHYLSATAGDTWIYTGIALGNNYNKAPMLDSASGLPLTLADYSRPFRLQYTGNDLQVNSTKLAP